MFANYPLYLHYQNEENLMKKALIDICFREEMANKHKKFDVTIQGLTKDDKLIKKLNELMKGSRYPSNGVQMD
jgi:hypothetical protein